MRPMRTALAIRTARGSSGGAEIDDEVIVSDG